MTYATSDYGFYLEPKHFPEFLSKIKAKFGTDFKDIYDATAFLDEEYISSIIHHITMTSKPIPATCLGQSIFKVNL